MFRSIIVPLDGSPLAIRALTYAALVAAPGARITLIGVVEPPINDLFTLSRSQEIVDEMAFCQDILSREVEAHAESLRSQGFTAVTTVRTGGAIGEIIGCAHDEHADLIVMTTHGTGGLARWAFGSVTNSVLHNTMVPALIVRAAATEILSGQSLADAIIAPLDGSPAAEEALPIAQELATRLALPLRIVRIINDVSLLSPIYPVNDSVAVRRPAAVVTEARERVERYVKAVVTHANGPALHATGTVLTGDPATTLAAYLSEQPNALIVMASHGEHIPQPWLFGNIAEKIVATAPNAMLIVHPSVRTVRPMHIDPALAARYPD